MAVPTNRSQGLYLLGRSTYRKYTYKVNLLTFSMSFFCILICRNIKVYRYALIIQRLTKKTFKLIENNGAFSWKTLLMEKWTFCEYSVSPFNSDWFTLYHIAKIFVILFYEFISHTCLRLDLNAQSYIDGSSILWYKI